MAVTDTAVHVADDRVEVHLGHLVEEPGSSRATATHTVHIFGDPDLLDALAADLTYAAEELRDAATAARDELRMRLAAGDALLLAGPRAAHTRLQLALQNANAFDYVQHGRNAPGGWIWRARAARKARYP